MTLDPTDEKAFSRRVVRSFLYTGAGSVVSKVVAVVALLVALAEVSAEAFGTASLVLAIIAILRSVTELGLGVALVQARDLRREQIDSLFWFSFLVALAFYALVAVAGAPLAAWFYEDAEIAPLLRVHSITILVFAFYFISRTFMERELQFGRITLIDNVSLLASSGLMIWLAYTGHGAWAFVWADVANRVGQAVLTLLVRPYRPRLRFQPREVWSLVKFGTYATGSRLLYNFYIQADYLIIGKVFGAWELGIYTFAYRVVADPVKALASVVQQVAYPTFALLQDQRARLRGYFFTIARLALAVIGLVLVAAVAFIDQVVVGFGFEQYVPALPLIYVFAGMGLLRAVAPLVPQLLNAVGRPRQNFLYSAVCAVVMPTAFIIGAQFSLEGVAISWVIGYPLVVLVLFWFGAMALELPLLQVAPRAFAGLLTLTPIAGLALVVRALLLDVAALDPRPAAITGLVATLALGALLIYLRERKNLAVLRKPPRERRGADA